MQGNIFDISRFMIEDGPGIRTNVFVKGCALRCKWCSNAFGLNLWEEVSFDRKKCVGCGACVSACPQKAIQIDPDTGIAAADRDKCNRCLKCVGVCKTKARVQVGVKMSSAEILHEVEKDQIFYRRGGGGVTISGGEILMQPEFVIEILDKCQNAYLDTAIETSGFGKWEDLKQMILRSNLVFIDCKLMDEDRHVKATGVSNVCILQNIKKAAALCLAEKKRLVIRLPLIPGINDDNDNLIKTAEFVKRLEGNVELNVLPYHNYGMDKYEKLGMEYTLASLKPYGKEELRLVEKQLFRTGVRFSIGGYKISK